LLKEFTTRNLPLSNVDLAKTNHQQRAKRETKMTDPNSPKSIAEGEAELVANKAKAVRDVSIILASNEDRIDCFDTERTPDCSPRFEAIIYPVYIGIWLYQDGDETRWTVEIDEVKNDDNWLEDGVQRGTTVQHASFRTFKDALGAANQVIETLSELSYFNSI
jgi:hypothetical protein